MVTGAARGIGRATAELLAERGAKLVLCDVDEGALEEVASALRAAGSTVHARRVDVADRAALDGLAEWIGSEIGALDVLVNNAGILVLGGLEETSPEEWERVFAVNFWGVVHACRALAPAMRRRGQARIVNVASAAGLVGFSPLLAYTATKFAVVGFSQALRAELAEDGVGVSVVCPGLVHTTLPKQPHIELGEQKRLLGLLERRGMPPERVAAAILRAAERNLGVVPVGGQAWLVHLAGRLFPSAAAGLIHRAAQSPSGRSRGRSADLPASPAAAPPSASTPSNNQANTSPRTRTPSGP